MNIILLDKPIQEPIEDITHMMSTEESDNGEESREPHQFSPKSETPGTDRSPLQNKSGIARSYSHQGDYDSSTKRAEGLADLLRDHDIRSSFKTKLPTQYAYDRASNNHEPCDFKDIIRRSRFNNRLFLLREYPEILLEARPGSCSMLFH